MATLTRLAIATLAAAIMIVITVLVVVSAGKPTHAGSSSEKPTGMTESAPRIDRTCFERCFSSCLQDKSSQILLDIPREHYLNVTMQAERAWEYIVFTVGGELAVPYTLILDVHEDGTSCVYVRVGLSQSLDPYIYSVLLRNEVTKDTMNALLRDLEHEVELTRSCGSGTIRLNRTVTKKILQIVERYGLTVLKGSNRTHIVFIVSPTCPFCKTEVFTFVHAVQDEEMRQRLSKLDVTAHIMFVTVHGLVDLVPTAYALCLHDKVHNKTLYVDFIKAWYSRFNGRDVPLLKDVLEKAGKLPEVDTCFKYGVKTFKTLFMERGIDLPGVIYRYFADCNSTCSTKCAK